MDSRIIKVKNYKKSVWNDLEDDNPIGMYIKSELVRYLQNILKKKKMSQAELSEFFDISQAKVSNLMNGKLYGFSVSKLLYFLYYLDIDIEISLLEPK